jgi:hypothetical protein
MAFNRPAPDRRAVLKKVALNEQTGPSHCEGPVRFVKISTLIVLPLPDTADGTSPTLAWISYSAN